MERDYLSTSWTTPIKIISVVLPVVILIAAVMSLVTGEYWLIAVFILVSIFARVGSLLCEVYFEGGELVIERFSRSIRVSGKQISDINYYGITGLLKLTFTDETELGNWVLFFPRVPFPYQKSDPIEDDGPIFEKIGRFCGWKST